ncbi:monocarboxylate transporter 13-like [Saccoglossus kowalevskii]|uniref:Monocarboxylate transporter 12-like n=1 Tax=Saccoglossus kowalevskii TaxID=10224 RepID=A0ABM0MMR6_SACKO|nr:PREDICTED: monocarboxylate transporter 12-like [Saccoglossus kowalevskii]
MDLQRRKSEIQPSWNISADGGWGWFVVIGSNIAIMICAGLPPSMGPVLSILSEVFDSNVSDTSWVLSLAICMVNITGPLASALTNKFGTRSVVALGAMLSCIGMIMSSFASSVSYLCISYGFITGIGYGLAFTPSIGILGVYFHRRFALANALAFTGTSTGFFIFPSVLRYLLDIYGWTGTFVVLTGLSANLFVCAALFQPRTCHIIETGRQTDDSTTPQSPRLFSVSNSMAHCTYIENSETCDVGVSAYNIPSYSPHCHRGSVLSNHRNIVSWKNELNKNNSNCRGSKTSGDESQHYGNVADTKLGSTGNLMLSELKNNDQTRRRLSSSVNKRQSMSQKLLTFLDWGLFCENRLFTGFTFTLFLIGIGFNVSLVHLASRGISYGLAPTEAALISSVVGISNVVGQFGHAWLVQAKWTTGSQCYFTSLFVCGVASLFSVLMKRAVEYGIYCAILGLTSGVYMTVIPVVLKEYVGNAKMTDALGLSLPALGIGSLIGPPISGWIFDKTGSYNGPYYLVGCTFLLSTTFVFAELYYCRWCTKCDDSIQDDKTAPPTLHNCLTPHQESETSYANTNFIYVNTAFLADNIMSDTWI